jgi:hypothetical protein
MDDASTLPGIGADYGQGFGSNDSLFAVPTSMTPLGLPADNQSSAAPPGFESTVGAVQPAPPVSTIDKIWDTIKTDSSSAVSWGEDEVKAAYSNTKAAAGTVVSDVTSPIASATKSIYMYAILGVIVLAGAIYFIGRGGAIGQAASFKP